MSDDSKAADSPLAGINGAHGEPSPPAPAAPEAPAPTPSAPAPASVASAPDPLAASTSRSAQWDADLRKRGRYTELAALLAFLVPGLGHVYLGRPGKGLVAFVVLVGLFGWGIGISRGECVSLAGDEESGHRYAFLAQVGAGLPTALALLSTHQYEVKHALGMEASPPPSPSFEDPVYVARLPKLDEGLLYTMIAGLLNLLLIYDAFLGAPGAALRPKDDAPSAAFAEPPPVTTAEPPPTATAAPPPAATAEPAPPRHPEAAPEAAPPASATAPPPAPEGT